MRQYGHFGRIYLILTVVLVATPATASRLDGALDALESGEQHLDVSWVPMYQNALKASADTGNYTLDAIGTFTLRTTDSGLGNTNFIFWVNSSDKLGGLGTLTELTTDAGLLWDPNDINTDSSNTSLLVIGVDQWFLDNTVSAGFGKFFPGQFFLNSPYTADNSNSFTSKMISGNPIVSFWEAIGIGANAAYFGEKWSVQGAFVDSKAEEDLDFSSFADAKFAYMLEAMYSPVNENGETSVGAVAYYIDARNQRESESGIVAQFTHEWGTDANYAIFGRYSYRDGGESEDVNNPTLETPVKHGGFVGLAWNHPFNRADEQLAAAFVYGEPADYKIADGFNSQYGIEVFWNWRATNWLKILPNVQFMRNIDDDIETIIGIRVNMGFQRSWRPGAP
jgi:carbohydrate-selective porin OprB